VPHNLFLSTKYNAHINVEICNTIGAVKYLYKYVYKGSDKVTFSVDDPEYKQAESNDHDEIKNFLNARYISASEAYWRILGFNTNKQCPKITRLPVHLEDEQKLFFQDDVNLNDLVGKNHNTQLTHFFELNITNERVRNLHYFEMPIHFRWHHDKKMWIERQR
jgi:hypothetical protein